MELNIRNQYVMDVINANKIDPIEFLDTLSCPSVEKVHLIMSCDIEKMVDGAENEGVELDLTYDTVKNISRAFIGVTRIYADLGFSLIEIMIDSLKTLAAYFALLAVNNHGFDVELTAVEDPTPEEEIELWAEKFSMKLNHMDESDFIPITLNALNTPFHPKKGFAADFSEAVELYKKLTGVDLYELGLTNMAVELDDVPEVPVEGEDTVHFIFLEDEEDGEYDEYEENKKVS